MPVLDIVPEEDEGLLSFEDDPDSGIWDAPSPISEKIRQRVETLRIHTLSSKQRPFSRDAQRLRDNLEGYWEKKRLDHFLNNHPVYKVFTKAHDEVVGPQDLMEGDDLIRHRAYLECERDSVSPVRARAFEEISDRLGAQLREVFNMHPVAPRDTVVTLLTDNSGAQRGPTIAATAILTDMLADKLDMLGVRTEILGHTTRAWKGGISREDWLRSGRPPQPGRLNDMRLIVYKDVKQEWAEAAVNLGCMLKEGMLKENIDGEALQWGAERLAQIPAKRRILVYIGKMLPMDDSTKSVNQNGLLEGHVRSAIQQIASEGKIELRGIHIGVHEPMDLFSHCVKVGRAGEELMERPAEGAGRLAGLFMGYVI